MAVCLYCGKEFVPKNKVHKCCCKLHTDRFNYRNRRYGTEPSSRDKIEERDKKISELALSGKSYDEIIDELGLEISCQGVYAALKKKGVKIQQKSKDRFPERNAEIVRLREQGHSYRQIAGILGLDYVIVGKVCRRYGLGGVLPDNDRTIKDPAEYVESYLTDQFSYVSGFQGCDGLLKIKCSKCGEVFDVSMSWIRNVNCNGVNCPGCARLAREEKEREKEREKEARAKERKALALIRAAEKEAERESKRRSVACEICGKTFITYNKNKVCCSPECGRKRSNRISSHRKDSRIAKEKRVDKNITALGLFVRDRGTCWICGGKCNPHDYSERDGIKICGNYYPSVDHVVPVSEGGADSWDNVRLAHRICNTKRYYSEKVPDGERVCT